MFQKLADIEICVYCVCERERRHTKRRQLLRMFIFFFSSRRRHTRYWRDWSSDVCSSDLVHATVAGVLLAMTIPARPLLDPETFAGRGRFLLDAFQQAGTAGDSVTGTADRQERKSGGEGKEGDIGGGRIIKKKKNNTQNGL